MEAKKTQKQGYAKRLLALLASKPAISEADLCQVGPVEEGYALRRSLKGLVESGLVERYDSGRQPYSRLTREGKKKAYSLSLDSDTTVLNPQWDGKWRIILLDIPEERKTERDALRYLLKKAGFALVKNAVWISPFPFDHLFSNIKKDLGLTTELMIFVTDTLDAETEREFLKVMQ